MADAAPSASDCPMWRVERRVCEPEEESEGNEGRAAEMLLCKCQGCKSQQPRSQSVKYPARSLLSQHSERALTGALVA